jgi:putative alpha-1,2-mannosidase
MKTLQLLAVMMGPALAAMPARAASDPVDAALPMVGTAEHGHAYPGAIVPFGMVQLSPDTPIKGWLFRLSLLGYGNLRVQPHAPGRDWLRLPGGRAAHAHDR